MKYFYVEPIVMGELDEGTVMDVSVHPPIVNKLVFQVDGWPGDVLVASFPCFLITEEAKFALQQAGFSGATFADVKITISDNFRDVYSDIKIPPLVWLKIEGEAGHSDFGIASDLRLVMSERILDVLDALGLPMASFKPFDDRSGHTDLGRE
ncbi:hypothetical protein [Mesorhizobium sp. WSM3868]|uniref:hypothetical protein n=1 Tax=Mesorhizobium sp. WSM3868 TaxID=2029405 RepID=UPI000BB0AA15|nr:hypothetical protein [Mesorhizobium sp. WSM3868]PBB36911.1 hypothetical protein CK221_15285 [Mesorhizobium sp. WSM3868]